MVATAAPDVEMKSRRSTRATVMASMLSCFGDIYGKIFEFMTTVGELLVRIKNDLSRNEKVEARKEMPGRSGLVCKWRYGDSFRNNHTRTVIRNYYKTF